jgi:hypothetical protein
LTFNWPTFNPLSDQLAGSGLPSGPLAESVDDAMAAGFSAAWRITQKNPNQDGRQLEKN